MTPRRFVLWRNVFLAYSETFVHDELRAHERWHGTVLCRQRRAAALFPWPDLIALEHEPPRRPPWWPAVTGRAAAFDRALAGGGFALIHAHFAHNAAWALPFARRHRLPLVVSLHGHDVTVLRGRERVAPMWWPWLWRRDALWAETALFLAASDDLAREAVALGFPAARMRVHRLGIDLQRFRRSDRDVSGPPRVVMAGRFVEKKGHADGLRAFARAVAAGCDARLSIVGDGPLRPAYQRAIGELGLTGRVELPGSLSHAALAELMRGAAVLLAPSAVARNGDRDSGLLVAKEAAACGVPVLATRHGGLPEIVDDGHTGHLVAEHDWRGLGDHLVGLLRAPARRAALGAAARLKMEREYDLRARVQALETIYDTVAG